MKSQEACFFEIDPESEFPIQNLPYGVIQPPGESPRVGVAIGEFALDLSVLEEAGLISTGAKPGIFRSSSLNAFARLGRSSWGRVRREIQELLTNEKSKLRHNSDLRNRALRPLRDLTLRLPFEIGGYTDFYASKSHATNVGRLFRGEENALMPNWKHIPIAYNGRASSVVVSDTRVVWPSGQIKDPSSPAPTFEPSKKMDYELEVGFIIGKDSELGRPIRMDEVEDYLFGMVLVNDWSARDIQAWEYQPLGPFLGKSFATTISPWVVPFEALAPFRFQMPAQDPAPLPYLAGPQWGYDIELRADLKTQKSREAARLTSTNSKYLYWSLAQMLVHHASNGCPMQVGDLLASGTISGPEREAWGCLLELTYNGKQPLSLPDGEARTFLQPGDEITMTGCARGKGFKIGFGSARGKLIAE